MKRLGLALLLLLPACEDANQAPPELLMELQKLRSSIDHMAERPAPVEVGKAMEPLFGAMQTLAQDQQDLRARQLTLTQEMAQLAGKAAAPDQGLGELKARLQKLEEELLQQDKRHQQIQELLRQALEKTSDKLEGFLQKLENVKGGSPPNDATAVPPAEGKAKTGAVASPWLQPDYQPVRGRREPWTIALLAAATLMVGLFAWRYWRAGEQRVRQQPPQDGDPGETEELWQAAALLSEAVGRLKAAAPAATASPTSAVPTEADLAAWLQQLEPVEAPVREDESAVAEDDVFALDDDESADEPALPAESGPADDSPVAGPAAIAPPLPEPIVVLPAGGPAWHELTLECARPEVVAGAVEAALIGDPRVLRRPAPVIGLQGAQVRVRYCLLPHLPSAEAVQLRLVLQRLASR